VSLQVNEYDLADLIAGLAPVKNVWWFTPKNKFTSMMIKSGMKLLKLRHYRRIN